MFELRSNKVDLSKKCNNKQEDSGDATLSRFSSLFNSFTLYRFWSSSLLLFSLLMAFNGTVGASMTVCPVPALLPLSLDHLLKCIFGKLFDNVTHYLLPNNFLGWLIIFCLSSFLPHLLMPISNTSRKSTHCASGWIQLKLNTKTKSTTCSLTSVPLGRSWTFIWRSANKTKPKIVASSANSPSKTPVSQMNWKRYSQLLKSFS